MGVSRRRLTDTNTARWDQWWQVIPTADAGCVCTQALQQIADEFGASMIPVDPDRLDGQILHP